MIGRKSKFLPRSGQQEVVKAWFLLFRHKSSQSFVDIFLVLKQYNRLELFNTLTDSRQRSKTHLNECPKYDTKQSDSEASVMLSPSSLPLLSGPLWPGVVPTDIYGSNRTGWYLNCAETNKWCLIELVMIHGNALNLLTVWKRILNRIISV